MSGRRSSASPGGMWPLLAALLLLVLHALLLADWVVDDAGITYAYARNLAAGHGLVAQSGQPPVEGFSNPLWTFVVAAFYGIGLFDVRIAPKLLGVALAAAVIVLVWQDLRRRTAATLGVGLPLLLIAGCSPFVIWTTSGLENALLAVLVLLSARLAVHAVESPRADVRLDLAAGVTAALAGLTRPDALVYAALYPGAVLLRDAGRGWPMVLAVGRRWLAFATGLAPVYGGYLLFRLRYFDDVVPNTFYAKQKPSLGAVSAGKLLDLVESASGDAFPIVIVLVALALGLLLLRRQLQARTLVLAGYVAAAMLVFLVMPSDWMGEYRFATAFYPLFFWLIGELAVATRSFWRSVTQVRAAQTAALIGTAQALIIFAARTVAFAAAPTVPLHEVQAYAGEGFNALAATLGATDPSVLTPDLGGALLDSKLKIYDLAGLCDRRIARALSANDTRAIQDYVFEDVRPTFIHMHGAFIRATRLHEDARFQRDYVAIHEHARGPAEWAGAWDGAPPAWSGDYVRRDVLGPSGDRLAALQETYRKAALDRFLPWVRPPDRLRLGWPQMEWAAGVLVARPAPAPRLQPVS